MGKVSPEHLDALCELDNITLGAAAVRLEKSSGIQVKMIKPKAEEFSMGEAINKIPAEEKVGIVLAYTGDYGGEMAFIFSKSDISVLTDALIAQGKADNFDSAMMFIGQEIAEGINESLAMLISRSNLSCSAQAVLEERPPFEDDVVFIEIQLKLNGGQVDSRFWHLVPVELGNKLASDMLGELDAQLEQFEKRAKQEKQEKKEKKEEERQQKTEEDELIPDIMVEVAVRLANKKMVFQDLWDINPGDVIEFPQYVSQPVELVYKQKVIAMAQVVVVGERFGVRITEVKDYAKGISS